MSAYHQTVLLRETVDALSVKDGGIYVDCTAGGGGHTAEILRRMRGGRVIAIDRDPDAIAYLSERFRDEPRVTLVHDEYRHIASILSSLAVPPVDGVVADLGISGKHVDDPERGFSYHTDAPLDMRMSKEGVSAAELVNSLSEQELAHIIFAYGEEKYARTIARNIVIYRKKSSSCIFKFRRYILQIQIRVFLFPISCYGFFYGHNRTLNITSKQKNLNCNTNSKHRKSRNPYQICL